MKLKDIVKSLEEVDEKYRDLYTQNGEEYVLHGIDDSETKKKLDEFRTNNRAYFKQIETLQGQLKKYEGIDPEQWTKAQEALKKQAELEDKDLIDKGKFDELFTKRTEAMRADQERALKAKDEAFRKAQEERDALKQKLGTHLIDAEIQKAVMRSGKLRDGAIDDVISRARKVWNLDEHGNIVPKKSGETAFGKDGEVLKMEEWAADLISEAPHLFEPSKGGGAEGGSTTRKDDKVIDGSDPILFGKNLEAIAKGKVTVK